MSRLSLFLPPFAGDYSGACSVLFPCDCMVVILDAGCCTRNYAEYDEPRWTSVRKPAFSAQIRTLDTVLGDEAGLINQVKRAARELEPACVALVGTPVPAIVGMDLKGLALDVADACGIPCIGIPTNGFDTYEKGVSAALCALLEAFALDGVARNAELGQPKGRVGVGGRTYEPRGSKLRVNVMGATPLDFAQGEGAVDLWRTQLSEQGIEVSFDGVSAFGPSDVAAMSSADASLVVSWGGLAPARLLQRCANVPFVEGIPYDAVSAAELADCLRAAVGGSGGQTSGSSSRSAHAEGLAAAPKLLLAGDQIAMNSVRVALERNSGWRSGDIAVGTFFSLDRELSRACDVLFAEDADMERYLHGHPDVLVVADPLVARLPSMDSKRHVELPHPAVSGQLFAALSMSGKGLLDEIRLRSGA